MTANEIIARAVYLSGIAGRSLNPIESDEAKDGLFFLNLILSEQSINGEYIPYLQHIQFDTVPGQEQYFVPNLVDTQVVSFNFDTVRYLMQEKKRRAYFGDPRANSIRSLPISYYSETVNGGTNIYLYFLPDRVYKVNVTGKFGLSNVTNSTDFDTAYDRFYQSYLIYELSVRLCEFYLITINPQVMERLESMRTEIRNRNPLDLTYKITSVLSSPQGFNYADVNLGKGWTRSQ